LAQLSGVDRWWAAAEKLATALERAAARDARTDLAVLRASMARQFERRNS
jgi:hypothetical protein